MSRQLLYTEALADTILERLAVGEALDVICASKGMPAAPTVRLWVSQDRDGFGARYARARQTSAEHWDAQAEQVLLDAPASKEEIARARELAQHYRWRASKLGPQQYGDRQQVDIAGTGATIVLISGVSRTPGASPPTIEGGVSDVG